MLDADHVPKSNAGIGTGRIPKGFSAEGHANCVRLAQEILKEIFEAENPGEAW